MAFSLMEDTGIDGTEGVRHRVAKTDLKVNSTVGAYRYTYVIIRYRMASYRPCLDPSILALLGLF